MVLLVRILKEMTLGLLFGHILAGFSNVPPPPPPPPLGSLVLQVLWRRRGGGGSLVLFGGIF